MRVESTIKFCGGKVSSEPFLCETDSNGTVFLVNSYLWSDVPSLLTKKLLFMQICVDTFVFAEIFSVSGCFTVTFC